MELEDARDSALSRIYGQWPSNAQENIARRNVNTTSSQFLTAPPDEMGFIPDDEFQDIFASYLGLPSPCCAPFVGQWIGTEGNQRMVDEHGNVLSAHNAVPGAGHSIAHNWVQAVAGDIAKASGMQLQSEAENLFHGRVREPFIGRYCQHYLSCAPHDRSANTDAIIPDILIHNYPVGSERRRDGNGISQASAPAIFEVKGIHVGKNQQVRYPAGQCRGTDKRAKQVREEYATKARKCDAKFAQDTPEEPSPFENALKTFLTGGPIPLVFGAFGEVNTEFLKFLKTSALAAASTEDGLATSPVKSMHDSRGAYPLILHKFRQVMGVTISRANAQLRLRRLHYIRPSKQAAALAAKRHMKGQTWTASGSSSWFARNERHQYEEWHKFCHAFRPDRNR
jgi:hypothetical protein